VGGLGGRGGSLGCRGEGGGCAEGGGGCTCIVKKRTLNLLKRIIMPAPYSDHLAVYKYVQVNASRKQHWTGYLQNEASREVLWCHSPSEVPLTTHYGPAAVDDGLEAHLYTEEYLAHDRRAGELVVDAMRLLRANGTAKVTIIDGPAKTATKAAITAIKNYYRKPVAERPSLDWLQWMEGLLTASEPKRVPKQCRKCGIDGCNTG